MIRVFFEKGRNCPAFVCEVCGERIKAGKGIYAFLPPTDGDSVEVHTVCKRVLDREGNSVTKDCDRELQRRIGRTWWGEIPALLGFLVNNAETTHKKAKVAADFACLL